MTAPALLDTFQAPARTTRSVRWRVFGASWALLSLLSMIWAIATPISASPDEPAHIVKAASVARGQFIGETSTLGQVVQVPRYIASTHAETCFAFHPDVAADCATPLPGSSSEIIDSTTSAGLYNPVYYVLVGWPSLLFGDSAGIYAMRAVSGILTSLFLAFTVMIAVSWRRNALPLAAVGLAVPPMLLFLGGSVNPNAVETAATLAVFAGMLAIVTQPNPKYLTERSMIVLAGAAIAANTRGLSPLWVAVAIFTPLVMLGWRSIWELVKERAVLWAIGGTAVATLFAMLWLLNTNSLTASLAQEDYFQSFPGVGSSPLTGFVITLRDTLGYAQGMVGNFGWLDTPAPSVTYFIWAVFSGALVLAAFSVLRQRALLLAGLLTAVFLFLPPIIQGAYITSGGIIWQGRYNLPLFAMLVFGLAALLADRIESVDMRVLSRLTLLFWSAWSVGQIISFASALKRYAVGADGSWKNMLLAPEWSAPGGNLTVLMLAALATVATAWLAWRSTRRVSGSDASLLEV